MQEDDSDEGVRKHPDRGERARDTNLNPPPLDWHVCALLMRCIERIRAFTYSRGARDIHIGWVDLDTLLEGRPISSAIIDCVVRYP